MISLSFRAPYSNVDSLCSCPWGDALCLWKKLHFFYAYLNGSGYSYWWLIRADDIHMADHIIQMSNQTVRSWIVTDALIWRFDTAWCTLPSHSEQSDVAKLVDWIKTFLWDSTSRYFQRQKLSRLWLISILYKSSQPTRSTFTNSEKGMK